MKLHISNDASFAIVASSLFLSVMGGCFAMSNADARKTEAQYNSEVDLRRVELEAEAAKLKLASDKGEGDIEE